MKRLRQQRRRSSRRDGEVLFQTTLGLLLMVVVIMTTMTMMTMWQVVVVEAAGPFFPNRNKNNNDNNNNHNLFMIGNSYVAANDLLGIVRQMLEANDHNSSQKMQTRIWSKGGWKWTYYATNDDMTLAHEMDTIDFRWVVLQEQSEIPGLYGSKFQNEWIDSNRAIMKLNNIIADHNAQTILFQTWGRLHKDHNPSMKDLYTDFLSHQSRIAVGYREYQRSVSTPDRPVLIAPVGYAFQAIYESMVEEGLDPEENGGKFANLYINDGSHPSPQGSYLAACVLIGVMTGRDVRTFDKWEYSKVDSSTQQYLREIAATTVENFCQDCDPNADRKPYVPPEEQRNNNNVGKSSSQQRTSSSSSSSSSFIGRFFKSMIWIASLAGCGVFVWTRMKTQRHSLSFRRFYGRKSRNSDINSTTTAAGTGSGLYEPVGLEDHHHHETSVELISHSTQHD